MKLKDILNETRIFQNNFIKLDIIKNEFKRIFGENTPEIKFDNNGMFIKLDNLSYTEFNASDIDNFSLSDAGIIDEHKNIKKFYIEFIKPLENDKAPETETEKTEETE